MPYPPFRLKNSMTATIIRVKEIDAAKISANNIPLSQNMKDEDKIYWYQVEIENIPGNVELFRLNRNKWLQRLNANAGDLAETVEKGIEDLENCGFIFEPE